MKNISQLNAELQTAVNISPYKDKTLVFGDGNTNTKILLIGEAPGGDEEKYGRPFVGKAGKNLDEFMDIVGINRNEIYITNVVKLRPTKTSPKTGNPLNRTPNKEEINFFSPFLFEEISIVNPKLVVTLGNVPLKAITQNNNITIGSVHGTLIKTENFDLFPLYHPASIIYNRSLKDIYIGDLQKLKDFL